MKTPPFLLGAALLVWGWQTDYIIPAVLIGALLEGSRFYKARWDFSDDDFSRIWMFCTLVFLGAAVYAFTSNQGPSGFRDFFENPNPFTQRNISNASSRTAASFIRWLPMIFVPFVGMQVYSSREGIPLEVVSLILRWRWKRAKALGHAPPATRTVDISYLYFALCLFAASVHPSEGTTFFWILAGLLAWALWPQRTRRFSVVVWVAAFLVAIGLAYLGQSGMSRLQGYLANINPQWLIGFGRRHFDAAQSRTELGSLGRLKASGQIVIRLEVKKGHVPSLLREASYRTFKGQTWYAEAADKDFFYIQDTNNSNLYVLVPGRSNVASVSIASYLDGGRSLLPLPSGSGLLENLTAYQVSKNALGAVLAEGPGLVVFDAQHGPGATMDSGPDLVEDTFVTPREERAVRQVASELHLEGQSTEEAVRTLTRYFLNHFTYSTWQKPRKFPHPDDTPLARFLLRSHTGHCEYFATAAVLLLREAHIPARYAVGYAVHEGAGTKFVVRQRDAHAWCLVWNEKSQTWEDLDLTPGTWIAAEAERASPLQWLRDAWSRVTFEFSKIRWGQSHWRRYLLWALVPTLALLLYRIIFQTRRRRHRNEPEPEQIMTWPGLDSEFYELELRLASHGLVRQRSEPLSEWLQRALSDPSLSDLQAALRELLHLHYRYRFDPVGLSPAERDQLRQAVKMSLGKLEEQARSVS